MMRGIAAEVNPAPKRKRNLPGNPDPEAEVIALSPKSLMATNRFICEICNKGFQRDQNLQLHKRGHNLPWKLKQRANKDQIKKKVFVCPETTCVHHDPSRALGDLTGIKKHFCRKHGEKKWKCEKCSKRYAVQSDWKAHSKICGTREYRCDCGTLFSRRDSFITHRAFCDALAEGSGMPQFTNLQSIPIKSEPDPAMQQLQSFNLRPNLPPWLAYNPNPNPSPSPNPHMSATALLQRAAEMGVAMRRTVVNGPHSQAHVSTETGLGSRDQMIGGFVEHDGTTSAGLLLQMHDMMMSSLNSPSCFGDAFGDDALTRDFLGMRSFSRKDLLTMAGLDPNDQVTSSSSNSSQLQNQNHAPWQG